MKKFLICFLVLCLPCISFAKNTVKSKKNTKKEKPVVEKIITMEQANEYCNLFDFNESAYYIFSCTRKNPDLLYHVIKNKMIDPNKEGMLFLFSSFCNTGDEEEKEDAFIYVKFLLENGADINLKDDSNETIIFDAISYKNYKLIDLILQYDIDLKIQNSNGNTALMEAIERSDISESYIEKLFTKDVGINLISQQGNTALNLAIYDEKYAIAKKLILLGADVNRYKGDAYSPLYNACDKNNFEIVKLLVEKGANVNGQSGGDSKKIPLSEAVFNDNYEMVSFLIQKGAYVSLKDGYGRTPLFFACCCEDERIPLLLIQKGGDINVKDEDGETPFSNVVYTSNLKLFNIYIKYKPDLKINIKNNPNLIYIMLDGCIPEYKEIPYDFEPEILKYLVKHGVNINEVCKDYDEIDTPLFRACRSRDDSSSIIQCLIDNGAKVNCLDINKNNALIYSLSKPEVIKVLIKNGINVNQKNSNGLTAFDFLIKYNSSSKYKQKEYSETLSILTNATKGAKTKLTLCQAIKFDNFELTNSLLVGADINALDINGELPLYAAISTCDVKMVSLILEKKPKFEKIVMMIGSKKYEFTPLIYAIYYKNYEIVELLIKHGASVNEYAKNIKDNYLISPIYAALVEFDSRNSSSKEIFIKSFVNNGVKLNFKCGKENYSDLMYILLEYKDNDLHDDEFFKSLFSKNVNLFIFEKGTTIWNCCSNDKKYVITKKLQEKFVNKKFITKDNLNLRSSPYIVSEYMLKEMEGEDNKIATLKKGTTVKVIGLNDNSDYSRAIEIIDDECGSFLEVELINDVVDTKGNTLAKGTKGWVFSVYLKELK